MKVNENGRNFFIFGRTIVYAQVSKFRRINGDISFMAILAGDHPSESVQVRNSALASENLATWKRCKIGLPISD